MPSLEDRAVALAAEHAARYPAWCAVDVYKLLFQACMGPEHAVDDISKARQALRSEWDLIEPRPGDGLVEEIGLHAPLWRLHLAVAKGRGLQAEAILEEFLRCAQVFPRRSDRLGSLWMVLCGEIWAGRVSVSNLAELSRLDLRIRTTGFPPVSHSAAYREAYAPAYRLVGTVDLNSPKTPRAHEPLFSH